MLCDVLKNDCEDYFIYVRIDYGKNSLEFMNFEIIRGLFFEGFWFGMLFVKNCDCFVL